MLICLAVRKCRCAVRRHYDPVVNLDRHDDTHVIPLAYAAALGTPGLRHRGTLDSHRPRRPSLDPTASPGAARLRARWRCRAARDRAVLESEQTTRKYAVLRYFRGVSVPRLPPLAPPGAQNWLAQGSFGAFKTYDQAHHFVCIPFACPAPLRAAPSSFAPLPTAVSTRR